MLSIELLCDPEILLLGIHPKEQEVYKYMTGYMGEVE